MGKCKEATPVVTVLYYRLSKLNAKLGSYSFTVAARSSNS
jgi:hypothetical protein